MIKRPAWHFAITLIWFFVWYSSEDVSAQVLSVKPEKSHLEVAIAAWGATAIPTAVALDGGYFAKHGLDVNISVLTAATSVQALISGQVDIYQGGATAIGGNLAGADII